MATSDSDSDSRPAVDDAQERSDGSSGGAAAPSGGRAGRNLPVAIAVGVSLALLIVIPLFTARPVFVAVVAAAIGLAVRELTTAVRRDGVDPPTIPLLVGGTAMLVLAATGGAQALVVGLLVTVLACLAWRVVGGRHAKAAPEAPHRRLPGRGLDDLAASALVAVYAPFCAGFAVLMAYSDDGPWRVVAFVATVVCSDVGGYATGVFVGKHPMAPSVSPKKSWEGFAGSAVACVIGGSIFLPVFFGSPVWHGVLFGLAVVGIATLGDLGESMVKRDLGVKDMGRLLPGHGGIMDRLDSLLPTAPVAWLLLAASAPSTTGG
jgi:phosphatidate cytidylyltransferase